MSVQTLADHLAGLQLGTCEESSQLMPGLIDRLANLQLDLPERANWFELQFCKAVNPDLSEIITADMEAQAADRYEEAYFDLFERWTMLDREASEIGTAYSQSEVYRHVAMTTFAEHNFSEDEMRLAFGFRNCYMCQRIIPQELFPDNEAGSWFDYMNTDFVPLDHFHSHIAWQRPVTQIERHSSCAECLLRVWQPEFRDTMLTLRLSRSYEQEMKFRQTGIDNVMTAKATLSICLGCHDAVVAPQRVVTCAACDDTLVLSKEILEAHKDDYGDLNQYRHSDAWARALAGVPEPIPAPTCQRIKLAMRS